MEISDLSNYGGYFLAGKWVELRKRMMLDRGCQELWSLDGWVTPAPSSTHVIGQLGGAAMTRRYL